MWRVLSFLFFVALLQSSCKNESSIATSDYVAMSGKTMGTYYRITYRDTLIHPPVMQEDIEDLLAELNDGLSTYIDNSIISLFNSYNDVPLELNKAPHIHFYKVYKRAQEIYAQSEGDFDPTVMPLVNFYGFGYTQKKKLKQLDSMVVRDILKSVSMDLVKEFEIEDKIIVSKSDVDTEMDFSAIAKGYAADVLGNYFSEKGIDDYLVDIGGEIVASGLSPKSKKWSIAISRPEENARPNEADILVSLSDVAMASSGNYRNFYEVDGKKYSHTINPKTGFPERSKLLGVSVIAANCMDADAYATACMVKGLEGSKAFIESLSGVEACLIYNKDNELQVLFSSGFGRYLLLGK
jgi:thiamine biosynthesis lipoprotein